MSKLIPRYRFVVFNEKYKDTGFYEGLIVSDIFINGEDIETIVAYSPHDEDKKIAYHIEPQYARLIMEKFY